MLREVSSSSVMVGSVELQTETVSFSPGAGTIGGSYTSNLSCNSPLVTTSGTTGTVHWNTGETSTTLVTEHTNTVIAGQAVDVITSTITAGKFAGDIAVATVTNIAPNLLDCLSEHGLTGKQGLVTYTIAGV